MPATYRVAAVPSSELRRAATVLFDAYSTDPAFAELYDLSTKGDLLTTRAVFDGHERFSRRVPGTTIGCYRGEELVGAIIFLPNLQESLWRMLAHHPMKGTVALVEAWLSNWRCRMAIAVSGRRRWQIYCRMATEQAARVPCLQILSIGVVESERRTGIARQLLDAVEAVEDWRDSVRGIQVNTWHEPKVKIYEQLGFEVTHHDSREGVDCWSLWRAMKGRGAIPTSPPSLGFTPSCRPGR